VLRTHQDSFERARGCKHPSYDALVVGFAGCILPVLPGPPIAFLSLLCLQATGVYDYGVVTLVVLGAVSLLLAVLDNLVPVWGVRRIGGSKAGILGGAVGVIVGLFVFPPPGTRRSRLSRPGWAPSWDSCAARSPRPPSRR